MSILRVAGQMKAISGCFIEPIDLVQVSGKDAFLFLQGQLTQDLSGMNVGNYAESLILNPDGKAVAYTGVFKKAEDSYLLETLNPYGSQVIKRLEKFKIRLKVDMFLISGYRLYDFGAENIRECLTKTNAQLKTEYEYEFRYSEFFATVKILMDYPGERLDYISDDLYELIHIKSMVPKMGKEITSDLIAFEIPELVDRCISFNKGCYVGQELMARLDARGRNVTRYLTLFSSENLEQNMKLYLEKKEVGVITRSIFDKDSKIYYGLGFLHRSVNSNLLETKDGGVVNVIKSSNPKL